MTSPVRMFFRQPRDNNHPTDIWRICVVDASCLLESIHSEVEDIYDRQLGPLNSWRTRLGRSIAPRVPYLAPGQHVS